MVPDSDKKKPVILGSGSHGLEILSIVDEINRKSNRYEVPRFFDDDKNKHKKEVGGVPVIKTCNLGLLSSKISTFGVLRVIQEEINQNIAKTRRLKEFLLEGLKKR